MIRVFVGCAPDGQDAEFQAVVEYSIRKHASEPVEIHWMDHGPGIRIWNNWPSAAHATPFSALRWAIPQACSFEGRAVYCDSDVLFLGDVAELWNQPMDGKAILLRSTEGKLRTCVMLFDCAKARDILPSVAAMKRMGDAHKTIVHGLRANREPLGKFEGLWNCNDLKGKVSIDDPTLKVLHFSRIKSQPHMALARRRLAAQGRRHWFTGDLEPHRRPEAAALFLHTLTQAEAAGYHPARYDKGHA